jgi:hypothetical protein
LGQRPHTWNQLHHLNECVACNESGVHLMVLHELMIGEAIAGSQPDTAYSGMYSSASLVKQDLFI